MDTDNGTSLRPIKRIFQVGNKVLDDPNPAMSPEAVRNFYAPQHAELLNAGIGSPKEDLAAGTLTYEFVVSMGRKG